MTEWDKLWEELEQSDTEVWQKLGRKWLDEVKAEGDRLQKQVEGLNVELLRQNSGYQYNIPKVQKELQKLKDVRGVAPYIIKIIDGLYDEGYSVTDEDTETIKVMKEVLSE